MDKNLINLEKLLNKLKEQYESDFFVVLRCVNEDNSLKNKAVITIFSDIDGVTYEETSNCYKVSYRFNGQSQYKYVYNDGHGAVFSPFFNESDIINVNGEKYIDKKLIEVWNVLDDFS